MIPGLVLPPPAGMWTKPVQCCMRLCCSNKFYATDRRLLFWPGHVKNVKLGLLDFNFVDPLGADYPPLDPRVSWAGGYFSLFPTRSMFQHLMFCAFDISFCASVPLWPMSRNKYDSRFTCLFVAVWMLHKLLHVTSVCCILSLMEIAVCWCKA